MKIQSVLTRFILSPTVYYLLLTIKIFVIFIPLSALFIFLWLDDYNCWPDCINTSYSKTQLHFFSGGVIFGKSVVFTYQKEHFSTWSTKWANVHDNTASVKRGREKGDNDLTRKMARFFPPSVSSLLCCYQLLRRLTDRQPTERFS